MSGVGESRKESNESCCLSSSVGTLIEGAHKHDGDSLLLHCKRGNGEDMNGTKTTPWWPMRENFGTS